MADDNPYAAGHGGGASHDPVPLELGAVFQRSWEIFGNHVGLLFGAYLLVLAPILVGVVLMLLVTGLAAAVAGENDTVMGLASFIGMAIYMVAIVGAMILQLGVIRIALNVVRGQPAELSMLSGQLGLVLPFLGASILTGIATSIGGALCIIPGMIAAFALQWFPWILVDRNPGAIGSLKQSWALSFPELLPVILFNVAIAAVGLALSCVTFGFGMLIAAPFFIVAQAVFYDALNAAHPEAASA